MTLHTTDKEKVKRVIPKASNKVIDAAVARLYIAYPNPKEWTYTGLSGAIVLVDDLVGHTFFLKLVDISGHKGVLWDQELYVDFQYNQDRSFFHTFAIEECLVGLLFDDTTDASHFYKRVTSRDKHGSKKTVQNKNAIALKKKPEAPKAPGPRGEYSSTGEQRIRKTTNVLYYDGLPPPEWRSLYTELANAGITEDMIADNKEFIKDYINQQGGPLVGLEPPIPRKYHQSQRQKAEEPDQSISHAPSFRKKAPPPPPPASTSRSSPSPPPPAYESQDSSSHESSRVVTPEPSNTPAQPTAVHRVPPPLVNQPVHAVPPPPPALSGSIPAAPQQYSNTAPALPPTSGRPVPPALPNAARPVPPALPNAARPVPPALPNASRPVPPVAPPGAGVAAPSPPARGQLPPPPASQGRLPPPAPPPRRAGVPPPAPASRNANASNRQVPPPPPSRATPQPQQPAYQQPAYPAQQPAYPSQQPSYPAQQPAYQPPPQQQQQQIPSAPPQPIQSFPPPPPRTSFPQPSAQTAPAAPAVSTAAPIPPPLPPQTANNGAPSGGPPPPAPPPPPSFAPQQQVPAGSGPAPPPPPPLQQEAFGSTPAAPSTPIPQGGGDGRDALLQSIRGAGLGSLRKVDKTQLDKPSVILQEQRGETPNIPSSTDGGAPGAPGGQGSLADALAAALNNRKAKVSRSDDESDGEDW